MKLLVDMDNTIVDWSTRFHDIYTKTTGCDPPPQTTWEVRFRKFPLGHLPILDSILSEPYLYNYMDPIPGAIETLQELSTYFDVTLCTTLPPDNPFAATEKVEWVQKHLGWSSKNIIMVSDKTRIAGDILFDDKPCHDWIYTVEQATWDLVYFDQLYNRQCEKHFRIHEWSLENVLEIIKKINYK